VIARSPTDEFLRIALSRGVTARPGPTPTDDELRRAVAAFEAVISDAFQLVNLIAPDVAPEFCQRAFNLREYARTLRARM
jgi:hypothetical protein